MAINGIERQAKEFLYELNHPDTVKQWRQERARFDPMTRLDAAILNGYDGSGTPPPGGQARVPRRPSQPEEILFETPKKTGYPTHRVLDRLQTKGQDEPEAMPKHLATHPAHQDNRRKDSAKAMPSELRELMLERARKAREMNDVLNTADRKPEPKQEERPVETVKVFYNNNRPATALKNQDYSPTDSMKQVFNGGVRFAQEATPERKLDHVFAKFNRDYAAEKGGRSLGVGDVIELSGAAYAVGQKGFEQVKDFNPTPVKEQPAQENAQTTASPRQLKLNVPGTITSTSHVFIGPDTNWIGENYKKASERAQAAAQTPDIERKPTVETIRAEGNKTALERMAERLAPRNEPPPITGKTNENGNER